MASSEDSLTSADSESPVAEFNVNLAGSNITSIEKTWQTYIQLSALNVVSWESYRNVSGFGSGFSKWQQLVHILNCVFASYGVIIYGAIEIITAFSLSLLGESIGGSARGGRGCD